MHGNFSGRPRASERRLDKFVRLGYNRHIIEALMRRVKKLSERAPADAEKLYAEGLALLGKKPLRLNGDKQDAACRAAFAARRLVCRKTPIQR